LSTQKGEGKIVEIELSENVWVALANLTSDFNIDITIYFETGAFSQSVTTDNENYPPMGYYGWECFVGDFTYMDGIIHPIFMEVLDNNDWIVANSSIFYDPTGEGSAVVSTENVPSLLEFNPTTLATVYSSDYMVFSDFTLGGVYEYEENRFLVACLTSGATITPEITGADIIQQAQADGFDPIPSKVKFRAAAVDGLVDYRGSLVLIDKVNNISQVFYMSPDGLFPSDIDMYVNGDSLIPESCFGDVGGRLSRIDSFGNIVSTYGNNTFNIINDTQVMTDDHLMISC